MSQSAPPLMPRTGIEVATGFFPLAFFLFACTPVTVINGQPISNYWGTRFYDLPPGHYHITIYFSYVFMSQCGRADVAVTVNPGDIRRVSYYMWPLMFIPGSISVS